MDEIDSYLAKLLEIDTSVWVKVIKAGTRGNNLSLSDAHAVLESAARGKKRRRHNVYRNHFNGWMWTEEADETTRKLQTVLDQISEDAILNHINAGMRSAQFCFECGVFTESSNLETIQRRRVGHYEVLIERC